ncbi:hypothetical protein BJL95_17255 [Methylomonas sp. LWB]|uniref:DUF4747 family protein n=1 Tax=Methylomonas sp. LWB TaxID=1905845 RepID=UPI0008D93683|nr:DUF4747 family protein [Methylomonas sp. LWB]OHX34416.1 hypothetical protein BJL95_17255 [Methylomonas sp. LWB]
MPREASIELSVLNIALHDPHHSERYASLFNEIYRKKVKAHAHGDRSAILGRLYQLPESDEVCYYGEVFKFIELDTNEPWLNLNSNKEAEKNDLDEIIIPEHLKPHLKRFPFIFFPHDHRLYISIRTDESSIGVNVAKKIFENFFCNIDIELEYGVVEVTIEPDRNKVEEIFKLHRLDKLDIELVRPNPDDHEEDEKRLLERLRTQNAKKMHVSLVATKHSTIEPDKETKILVNVAASNGYVEAKGRDVHEKPVILATKESPLKIRVPYSKETQTAYSALKDKAEELHGDKFWKRKY